MFNSVTVLLFLTTLSFAYISAMAARERLRLAVSYRRVASMLGVFTFAGTALLPMSLVIGFVPLVYLAAWPTFRRAGQKPGKWAYSAGAATAGCIVSSELLTTVPSMLLSLPVAIAAFMLVNLAIVAVPIILERDQKTLAMLAKPRTHRNVLVGQVLGAAVGQAMMWHLPAGLLGLPLLLAIHTRTTRTAVIEAKAYIDGVWTWEAWVAMAEETHRSGMWFSTIVVDLADPADTAAAGRVLTGFLEAGDRIGRLGTGQLAMLLEETTAQAAGALVRLISAELTAAGVLAGVGSADCQRATLDQMLVLACGDAIVQGASAPRAAETL